MRTQTNRETEWRLRLGLNSGLPSSAADQRRITGLSILKMGTRAAAFSAKIKSLRETQQKVSLGLVPTPTGSDLSTSYRWFSTTLLSILRDVPGLPYHMIRSPELDSERLSLYPILDYRELYETVYENIDEHEIDGDMLMKMEVPPTLKPPLDRACANTLYRFLLCPNCIRTSRCEKTRGRAAAL